MALINANVVMTFTSYEVRDDGISMTFVATAPGAGQATDYTVLLTDADLSAITTQAQLRTAVTTKLQRKLRASGIATKLDPFIGQTITV